MLIFLSLCKYVSITQAVSFKSSHGRVEFLSTEIDERFHSYATSSILPGYLSQTI